MARLGLARMLAQLDLGAGIDLAPLAGFRGLVGFGLRLGLFDRFLGGDAKAIDDDANQTGQMLAAIWERPQATYASKVEIAGDKASVTREVDAGLETIEVDLPAVVTVDLRLNEPRYVKLPDIMKAKKKPLDVTSLDALGVSAGVLLRNVKTEPPAQRQKGVMVKDVAELIEVLKKKGVI